MPRDDRALVLGFNDYDSVGDLRGCVNDARRMAALLAGPLGFPARNVRTILDRDGTGAAVRKEMAWLAEGARPGDRRVLHVSGHGSFTADTSGDEAGDRVDELVCLPAMAWGDARTYLLDDELRAWCAGFLPGVRLTVVLDCCHSGTGTRALPPPLRQDPDARRSGPLVALGDTASRASAAGADVGTLPFRSPHLVLARFAPPPPEVAAQAARLRALDAARGRRGTRARSSGASGPAGSPIGTVPGQVLLAACRADQTAADAYLARTRPAESGFGGAFTDALVRIVAAQPDLTIGMLRARLNRAMAAGRFQQVPQVEGTWEGGGPFGAAG